MLTGMISILSAHAEQNDTWNLTTTFPDGKWGAVSETEKNVNAEYDPATQLFKINFKAPGRQFNSPTPSFFYEVFYKVTGSDSGKVYKEGSTSIFTPVNKFESVTFSDINADDSSYKFDVTAYESVETGPIYPPDFTPYRVDAHARIVKN
ncbi:hypothetical protein [Candidatus Enterococcus ikei]|uniref:Uncharacterized protein n=1 Tax=Candidatus Enterococcus ikei TaxID=2815326 RepID=A0ABS3GWL7_9ENTE|nr:hypothetical protein [Enterococcus sp. DIV0869a]MBO0439268.1 hypothetical protein [Enterococcus sp. DIV0869a]